MAYRAKKKSILDTLGRLEAEKLRLDREYGVRVVGVFGSYVRNEQRPDSDIDILVELERPLRISFIGLVELEYELSELLGVKVDIAIKKYLPNASVNISCVKWFL